MVILCAWCKAEVERNELEPVLAESHGICPACVAVHFGEMMPAVAGLFQGTKDEKERGRKARPAHGDALRGSGRAFSLADGAVAGAAVAGDLK